MVTPAAGSVVLCHFRSRICLNPSSVPRWLWPMPGVGIGFCAKSPAGVTPIPVPCNSPIRISAPDRCASLATPVPPSFSRQIKAFSLPRPAGSNPPLFSPSSTRLSRCSKNRAENRFPQRHIAPVLQSIRHPRLDSRCRLIAKLDMVGVLKARD